MPIIAETYRAVLLSGRVTPAHAASLKKALAARWAGHVHVTPEHRKEVLKRAHERWYRKHRERILANCRRRYQGNRHVLIAGAHWYWMEKRYGLTLDSYHAIFERQNEQCAICHTTLAPLSKETHLDHDHSTKKVRGLLCRACNMMLGNARDRRKLLLAGAEYLRHHGSE